MSKLFIPLTVIIFLTLSLNCSTDKKNKDQFKEKVDKELDIDQDLANDLKKAKRVFYSLPSPLETAMLLKRSGTNYNPQLINPTTHTIKYNTTAQKALNFGVYGADLSYAHLFSQTQQTIELMAASKKLADELGILGLIDNSIVQRLEKNINNRDSGLAIITEAFMTSNSYLSESGRPEAAVLVLAGGWMEGLYLATNLSKSSPNNNELIDRIMDQKLSLVTLLTLLSKYDYHPDVKKMLEMVYEIKSIFDQIQIVTSKVEPVTDNNNRVTTLQSKSELFFSEDVFQELCQKTDSIRNIITG